MFEKITIIGDIHGRDSWKKIVEAEKEDTDLFVFLGDYFDSYDFVDAKREYENFLEILDFKKNNMEKVVLLVGNHDIHYIPGIGKDAERYNPYLKHLLDTLIGDLIEEDILQVCKIKFNWIFSHAGLSNTWLRNNRLGLKESEINNYLKKYPGQFLFNQRYGADNYGDDVFQGPCWIREESLKADNIFGYMQFIGHTQVLPKVKRNEFRDINFCDSLAWNRYYVIDRDPIDMDIKYYQKIIK